MARLLATAGRYALDGQRAIDKAAMKVVHRAIRAEVVDVLAWAAEHMTLNVAWIALVLCITGGFENLASESGHLAVAAWAVEAVPDSAIAAALAVARRYRRDDIARRLADRTSHACPANGAHP